MDKIQLLKEIEEECRNADLPLKAGATNLVFGKGDLNAEIMFVGEAPGKNEDLQGLPFVGAAGKNLDKLLEKVGLSLKSVYIANILKYRPPENREPNSEEIKAHTPWLCRQISGMKPKVICSLGNYSTKFFLANGEVDKMKEQEGITKLHGKVRMIDFNGLNIKLIPLFHPAAIIYNQKLKVEWENDMVMVKQEIGQKSLA
ncbi:MAG: uracil-DNA glycosylase [archaeon]|nr:uracil-DNA glycosylase [archaeon]